MRVTSLPNFICYLVSHLLIVRDTMPNRRSEPVKPERQISLEHHIALFLVLSNILIHDSIANVSYPVSIIIPSLIVRKKCNIKAFVTILATRLLKLLPIYSSTIHLHTLISSHFPQRTRPYHPILPVTTLFLPVTTLFLPAIPLFTAIANAAIS
jgi:hypothetical protein